MSLTDDAGVSREEYERLVTFAGLKEDVMEQVSDRAVGVGLLCWAALLCGAAVAYLTGNPFLGSGCLMASAVAVSVPKCVASVRYLSPLSPTAVWWMLRGDHNATLFFGAAFLPPVGAVIGVGLVAGMATGVWPVAAAAGVVGAVVMLPLCHLLYVHRDELLVGFLASVRALHRVVRR